jgi:hypothetical protein
MVYGKPLGIMVAAVAALGLLPTPACAASRASVTGLSNVNFGVIGVFSDQTISQNICVYAQNATGGYSVTASGDGASGSFALSSGGSSLAYEVLWSSVAGQVGGTQLSAGVTSPGFVSNAAQKTCNSGPASSASVTLAIRASALNGARAGTYSGTLQITIVPD